MNSSLLHTRKVRRRVGFKIPREEYRPDDHIPWEPVDITPDDFLTCYLTNAMRNRTDDVCWLWAIEDLYLKQPQIADWSFVYNEGSYFFDTYYSCFFDEDDGLYRGQATFIDIGYPPPSGTGYDEGLSVYQRIKIKTLSTNCLYLFGMGAMAKAAAEIGKAREAEEWLERRDRLKGRLVSEFLLPNGKFAYYKRPDGSIEERSDAMGTSLAILAGVVSGENARRALADHPISDAGVALFHPFFPTPRWYHNHSSWPFVDAFFLKARSQATSVDERPLIAALLALSCVDDGRFHEVRDYRSKKVLGSTCQLWTAAAFLGLFE